MIIMFVLALSNAAGDIGSRHWIAISDLATGTEHIVGGLQNINMTIDEFFILFTVCIGVLTIADERSSGTLSVIITKPIYRRDVVLGKFIGISMILLGMIILTFMFLVSMLIAVNGDPGSITEVTIRTSLLIFLLFIYCCFTLGLVMCFGILFSKGVTLVASLVYACYELYKYSGISSNDPLFGFFVSFDPINLYYMPMVGPIGENINLFDTAVSFITCMSNGWPYIVLLVLYVIIIILIDIIMFNRQEL
jgi:ABC-2 type transport system permease protein